MTDTMNGKRGWRWWFSITVATVYLIGLAYMTFFAVPPFIRFAFEQRTGGLPEVWLGIVLPVLIGFAWVTIVITFVDTLNYRVSVSRDGITVSNAFKTRSYPFEDCRELLVADQVFKRGSFSLRSISGSFSAQPRFISTRVFENAATLDEAIIRWSTERNPNLEIRQSSSSLL